MTASDRHWLLLLVGTIGITGSLVMGQILLARPGWRIDLSPERRYVLSEHARRLLADLDREVKVTAFLRSDDPRNREIEDLLSRLAGASPRIHYRAVDVNRYPAVAREFDVDIYGAVVVECDGRRAEFAQVDEQMLLAAIIQLTRTARRTVYFLTGHGERSAFDRDRRSGYSQAHISLAHELYQVADLRLDGERGVPDGPAALVIAGPRTDLGTIEIDRLEAYVRAGGGLLVLLDTGDFPNLVAFLSRHGIDLPDQIVLDAENRLFAGDHLTMLVPKVSREHPVTAPLQAVPLMSGVRPVMAAGGAGASPALLETSAQSWRTSELAVLRTGRAEFVAGRDARGPVPVAATASAGGGANPGRILVYGDSDFASNSFLEYLGNRDLFLNSVNWLAGEESLLVSRPPPKVPGVQQLFISERQGRMVFLLGTVGQPLAVLLLGFVVVLARRRSG